MAFFIANSSVESFLSEQRFSLFSKCLPDEMSFSKENVVLLDGSA